MAKQYRVWLDAGHGGTDSGACANGLKEKQLNLVTTLECRNVLSNHGVLVGLTRTGDTTHSIDQRCKLANNWKADYFVSIHHNAGGGDGAEAIHSIVRGKGEELAKNIVGEIKAHTGQNLRPKATFAKKSSSGTDYYGVIRGTTMKAVIVECAFLDSADHHIVDTTTEQKAMGVAIAKGVLKQLGIAYKGNSTPPVTVPSNPNNSKWFKVCVGSFNEQENALKRIQELKSKKISNPGDIYALWAPSVKKYRVYAGAFKQRQNADDRLKEVKSKGFTDAFIIIE